MSINRRTDEDVVHIYSGISLSHTKEWNNVIRSNMNGPRDCHTEWSESMKDKYHMTSLICGLKKKGDRTIQIQNRKKVTNVENKHGYQGARWGRINWKIDTDTYTLLSIKQITNKDLLCSTGSATQHSVMSYGKKNQNEEWIYLYV